MNTPCIACARVGKPYDKESEQCKNCEHNWAINILKKVMFEVEGCKMCENRQSIGEGFLDCQSEYSCDEGSEYILDIDSINKEYKG